jgi:hypothetical protein
MARANPARLENRQFLSLMLRCTRFVPWAKGYFMVPKLDRTPRICVKTQDSMLLLGCHEARK